MDEEDNKPQSSEEPRELTLRERSNLNLPRTGRGPLKHSRLNVIKLLAQHNYNPVINMIEQLKSDNLPANVRADLNKELLSYAAVKPRFAMEHEVASKNADSLTHLLEMIGGGGHQPRPTLASTIIDADAILIRPADDDGDIDPESGPEKP